MSLKTRGPLPLSICDRYGAPSCLLISGCRFGGRDGGELVISHLLYADDTVLFYEADSEQLMYLG